MRVPAAAAKVGRMWKHDARQLFETGVVAPAMITGIRATGTTGNFDSIVLWLQLEVRPPAAPPFPARVKAHFLPTTLPLAGDEVEVAFDPADRRRIALRTSYDAGPTNGVIPVITRRGTRDPDRVDPPPTGWEIGLRRSMAVTFALIGLVAVALGGEVLRENPGQSAAGWVALGFGAFGAVFGLTALGAVVRARYWMLRARREYRLLTEATRTTGVLEDIRFSPRTVINDVLTPVRFVVAYPGPDEQVRRVRDSWLMPLAAIPQLGDRVLVGYDARRPDRVALHTDWSSFVAGGRRMVTRRPAAGETVPPPRVADRGVAVHATPSDVVATILCWAALAVGIGLVVAGLTGVDPVPEIITGPRETFLTAGAVVLLVGFRPSRLRPRRAPRQSFAERLGSQLGVAMVTAGTQGQEWFERGKQADAVITAVTPGFGSLNSMNVMTSIGLHVTPRDEPAFDVRTQLLLAINALPSVGDAVRVGYNPELHEQIGLEVDRTVDTMGGLTLVTRPAARG